MSEQNANTPKTEIPEPNYIPPVDPQAPQPQAQAPYQQPYQQPNPPQDQYLPPAGSYNAYGITPDDKTWGGLSYIPIIGLIVLFIQDKAARPFIKKHAVQSVALAVVYLVAELVFGWIPIIGWILSPIMTFAYFVYSIINLMNGLNGKDVNIPVITDFVRRQGWIK